jgi:integrase
MALTELGIRKLKAPKAGRRREKYDREIRGFGIRVTDRGVRSYILLYTHGGRRRRYTIGRIGEIGLEEAREKARELRGLIRQGRDPAADEKAARAVAKSAVTPKTFCEVVDLYEKRVLDGKRRGREVRMTIDRHLMPGWGDMPITSITRAHVLERVEGLVDAGMIEGARRVLEISRRVFNWTISRGTFGIEHSPCEKLRPADIVGAKVFRTRTLSDSEWRAFFLAVQQLEYPIRAIFELLALTGLRRNEIAGARWTEFADLNKAEWTIAPERMKNNATHVVPLTPEMLSIINALPRTGKFLFLNNKGNRPFTSFTAAKARIDSLMLAELRRENPSAELKSWVVHDIRRSMRTHLSMLPVPGGDLVRELILAHAKPSLHKVYDQFAYLPERRRAYELWQEKLTSILENRQADIIELQRERASESR